MPNDQKRSGSKSGSGGGSVTNDSNRDLAKGGAAKTTPTTVVRNPSADQDAPLPGNQPGQINEVKP